MENGDVTITDVIFLENLDDDENSPRLHPCNFCFGTGQCQTCEGNGFIIQEEWNVSTESFEEIRYSCNDCYGSGQCQYCFGMGDVMS